MKKIMFNDKYGLTNEIQNKTIDDLFMAPIIVEGWINLYRKENGIACSDVYKDKDEAMRRSSYLKNELNYITTIKIEWEE